MTSPAHLTAVRESYDALAADYFAQVPPVSGMDPLNRGMPGVFAELVRADGSGPVADLGWSSCSPRRASTSPPTWSRNPTAGSSAVTPASWPASHPPGTRRRSPREGHLMSGIP